ncbi:MAG TPA: FecR domain-containing protein [Cyclobacteriaceae bacterium]|nr:FecR domain-containing protein [Cyclobacteriaceae bacterium]
MNQEKLIRFLNHQASLEEQREVIDWLDQPQVERELENLLEKNWAAPWEIEAEEPAVYEKLLKRIHERTSPTKKKDLRNNWMQWAKMAASFALLLLSAFVLFHFWNSRESLPHEIIVYEKNTKAGEKLRVKLPDRSTVILNSLSCLRYEADFGINHRTIYLEGEAYIEVQPNGQLPFVVQTQELSTTAIGTAFNVRSRGEHVAVALTEGIVSLEHHDERVTLLPGQQGVLDYQVGARLRISDFDPALTIAWKEGKIHFRSKPLKDVLQELQDWYGVQFHIEKQLNLDRKVTGLFNNEDLDNIMQGLSFALDFHFSINANHVTIKPKKPMK